MPRRFGFFLGLNVFVISLTFHFNLRKLNAMENEIRNNTPIRRMGLSRKRKSCSTPKILSPKIQVCGEKYPEAPTHSENCLEKSPSSCTKECEGDNQVINYDDGIKLLKNKTSDAEEKLRTLQCNINNITQLEHLIEIWKSGFKKVYLEFSKFVEERQTENDDFKALLIKLGVLETLVETFNNDPEISLPD